MKVVYYIFTSTPEVVRIHFQTNPRTQVFFKKKFFPLKSFRSMTTPKLGILRPNKVLGPHKMKNTYFLKKTLSSRICPKVDSVYPRGTFEIVVYHFHGTMQTIITSSLRPVCIYLKLLQQLNLYH